MQKFGFEKSQQNQPFSELTHPKCKKEHLLQEASGTFFGETCMCDEARRQLLKKIKRSQQEIEGKLEWSDACKLVTIEILLHFPVFYQHFSGVAWEFASTPGVSEIWEG